VEIARRDEKVIEDLSEDRLCGLKIACYRSTSLSHEAAYQVAGCQTAMGTVTLGRERR
jgi:hypothetical protein